MKLEVQAFDGCVSVEWSWGTQSGVADGPYAISQEDHGPVATFSPSEIRGNELPAIVKEAIESEIEDRL